MNKKKYKFTRFQRNWIDALKSGRFRQSKGLLHRKDAKAKVARYCCLGVACKLAKDNGVELKITHGDNKVIYSGDYEFLPKIMVKELKLYDELGTFKKSVALDVGGSARELDSLVEMNDMGVSHKRIGEYIEQNPENVFRVE